MSTTDRLLLGIGRALVMNPEVLVIHKPLVQFDHVHANHVVHLLREYVDLRGIEEPPETLGARRLRTCIFSSASTEGQAVANTVLKLSDGAVELVDMQTLHRVRDECREAFEVLDADASHF